MKKIIWKIIKFILLFVFLYFGFFIIPSTIVAFKVGFQTHDADLAGQRAAQIGEMMGEKYGAPAFWIILILCIVLGSIDVYKEINRIKGEKEK